MLGRCDYRGAHTTFDASEVMGGAGLHFAFRVGLQPNVARAPSRQAQKVVGRGVGSILVFTWGGSGNTGAQAPSALNLRKLWGGGQGNWK